MANRNSKSSYGFKLVSTLSDSEDEQEEDTVFVSDASGKSMGVHVPDELTATKRRRNRIFAVAIFGILLLITALSLIYIAYSVGTPPSSTPANVTSNGSTISSENDQPSHHHNDSSHSQSTSDPSGWQHDLQPALTELSIVVNDINHDGIPDLIFDVITERLEIGKYLVCPDKDNSCMEDFGFTPCRVHLVALDGQNGNLIWEKWIEFSPFAANCEHDLNRDGIHDCTFSGRQGSFAALNPVDGSFLWYIDPAVTFPTYNYYYPLFIRDFDGDEVIDIIVTHGGDTVYGDDVKKRSTGFIFVVSGRTGQQLSDRIPIPDGHETYSNPIAYSMAGNIDVILFGSGGETIAGSLWAITVESLQENVNAWKPNRPQTYDINKSYIATQCLTDEEVRQMRPKFEKGTFKYADDKEDWLSECPVWNTDTQPLWNPYKICAYEIIPAGKTGTIIPPVIIDYNNDGIKDLLVSQFNDHVMMMDGATTSIVWDHYAEDTQSYRLVDHTLFIYKCDEFILLLLL